MNVWVNCLYEFDRVNHGWEYFSCIYVTLDQSEDDVKCRDGDYGHAYLFKNTIEVLLESILFRRTIFEVILCDDPILVFSFMSCLCLVNKHLRLPYKMIGG